MSISLCTIFLWSSTYFSTPTLAVLLALPPSTTPSPPIIELQSCFRVVLAWFGMRRKSCELYRSRGGCACREGSFLRVDLKTAAAHLLMFGSKFACGQRQGKMLVRIAHSAATKILTVAGSGTHVSAVVNLLAPRAAHAGSCAT